MTRRILHTATAALLAAAATAAPVRAACAQSTAISYIFRGLLTGVISGQTYTAAPFSFTFNTNTTNVFAAADGPRVNNLTPVLAADPSLPPVPPGIAIPNTFFVQRVGESVLFGLTTSAFGFSIDAPLVTVFSPTLAGYGLTTAFPLTASTSTAPIMLPAIPGSGLSAITLSGASFQAIAAAVPPTSTVPEPATWALLGTGLSAVGGIAARRRRAASC